MVTNLLQFAVFMYQNGLLSSRPYPRAIVKCKKQDTREKDGNNEQVIKIRVVLARPLEVKAGQYVNLWMPSVSFWSWTQTHPFMVTSWSPGKQDTLELFVQPRQGFTASLQSRAAFDGSASFFAFVSGPYGTSKPVSQYETVLVVASGFGITGVGPYIKQILHGYNTSTSRIRHVHLVWQLQALGKSSLHMQRTELKSADVVIAAQPLLNSLLTDDVLDNGYVC